MAEATLFADLPFPDDLPEFPHSVDDAFALEDFNLDDLDFDLDLDLFPTDDVQLPSPPPPSSPSSGSPAGGSSSSAGSPAGGSSSSSGAGVEAGPKNDESSESSSRSATAANDGKPADGEDKRRARLVRNRESAHLSRQRKKQYVDELEAKLKAMQATIADLSARISCVTAENAALKHQLATTGAAGTPPPLPMYPGLYPLPPPWIHPAYAMRGSQVPLMPIPRLKTRQPAPPAGAEPPAKKAKKTKKVASVSLLGLLLLTMLCGCLLPAVNRMYGTADSGEGVVLGQSHHGRILAVDGPRSSVSEGIDTNLQPNASETLPALLYIPRNGKHVKINGNLVIKSVVASEKASSRMPRSDGKSSVNQGNEETGLAIPRHVAKLDSVEVVESAKRITNKLIALPPGDGSIYREDDELLPQWFSEAMSGPMLSSGMCTEVFQFDTSPTSADPNGIVPVYSSAMSNSSHNFTENVPSQKVKTRRILHSMAIPVQGSTSNHTDHLKAHPENESFAGNKPASSVVVSVLADPREDADGRISSKSLSRIFVVVLIDSVKYVTYSCVLPFKNHSPHL
ncbi:bZIP transcription factor 60-like [Lolium rigidum]|uniref:bZIP transcription factor 60-like n=1 Tax=Lolium rigidum TaxID=89674 RepID=UPI001F5CB314|nr:bZIP transcription factor 60-like [Lolium rigidum]